VEGWARFSRGGIRGTRAQAPAAGTPSLPAGTSAAVLHKPRELAGNRGSYGGLGKGWRGCWGVLGARGKGAELENLGQKWIKEPLK
jgi:hypothetical protein